MGLSCLPIGGVLPRIVDMLADTMPAVSAAAANCLHKISGLYIGVQVSWVARYWLLPLDRIADIAAVYRRVEQSVSGHM